MSEESNSIFYIELNKDPIRFESVSKITNVFFDDANRQVFAVRSGGVTGVVVKGPKKQSVTFRMEDRGDVISIKFSHDMKILAIQRSQKSVEFVNFCEDQTTELLEYSQLCKGKTTQILGFVWTNNNEIVFITNQGIEFYQVNAEKRNLKCLKSFSIQVNWLVWSPESSVLLLSTGILGNILQPFVFRSSTVIKLPKFEVDLSIVPKPPKLCLLERDVTLATIYGNLYIIVLQPQPRTAIQGAEIALYLLNKETPARRTDILHLGLSGRFAVNVVDNLIVVHHQASKTSMMFDIKLESDSDGFINYHEPVLSPLPIKPCTILMPTLNLLSEPEKAEYTCELYSPNWIVFQPDIIIDAKLGCLWNVEVKLEPLITMIPDKCRLVEFLLLRHDSKPVILRVCKQMLTPGLQAPLATISTIFDMLNAAYKNHNALDMCGEVDHTTLRSEFVKLQNARPVIDQSDMYSHVFSLFQENKDMNQKFTVAVYVEYIRSLNQVQIHVQHYLYELLINTLVNHGCFYQLHQFIQYHVLSDSKPLACLMLSLESIYPPAYQLALDMLKRLSTANEEIIEVLLSKQELLAALRFLRSISGVDTASARKFLEAAMVTKDNMLFYTVYKFFEQRNTKLRGDPHFLPGEHCQQYVHHFQSLFGTPPITSPDIRIS